MQCGVLGALITLSDSPWYAAYALTTTAWGLTPIDGQRLAGLLYLAAGVILCGQWVSAEGGANPRRGHERAASHPHPGPPARPR